MASSIIKTIFNSKAELYNFLKDKFKDLSSSNNYNLFVHKAYDFDEYGKQGINTNARNNMKSILTAGLNLNKYSSIQQTSVYKGDLNAFKADDVLNYDYPWKVSEQVVVIIAIPCNVPIFGHDIDFSTPVFNHSTFNQKRSNPMENQYTMAYDALKFDRVHKEFILGSIITNLPEEDEKDFIKNGKTYRFYENKNHISNISTEEQKQVLQQIATKICYDFNISKNLDENQINSKILHGIVEKDKVDYKKGTYEDDFDFD